VNCSFCQTEIRADITHARLCRGERKFVFGFPLGRKDLLCSPKHPDCLRPTSLSINGKWSNCSAAKAAGTWSRILTWSSVNSKQGWIFSWTLLCLLGVQRENLTLSDTTGKILSSEDGKRLKKSQIVVLFLRIRDNKKGVEIWAGCCLFLRAYQQKAQNFFVFKQ